MVKHIFLWDGDTWRLDYKLLLFRLKIKIFYGEENASYFQFGWPVIISESAKLFGHRTQGALGYFYNCKDFHKTFAFIAAFSEAATKVLW